MKRLIPVLLALILLAGCSSETQNVPTTESAAPVKLGAIYTQASAVETATNGAVNEYKLTGQIDDIQLIDRGLVLGNEQGQIGLLAYNNTFICDPNLTGVTVLSAHGKQVIGYNSTDGGILVMDDTLNVVKELKLEEGIIGKPVYGVGTSEIYYCVEGYIRALNLETGLSRHVMQHAQEVDSQLNCYFDGSIIGWKNGETTTYLSSSDGQTLFNESELRDFTTGSSNYYGVFRDGFVDQYIWGQIEGEALQLVIEDEEIIYPQMNADSIVTVRYSDQNTVFRRYDMTSGKCVGFVDFKLNGKLLDIVSNAKSSWILTDAVLYCWDYEKSAVNNSDVYTIPLINSENLDTEGIEQCRLRAEAIAEAYGIDIYIWDEAMLHGDNYVITGEYQVEPINAMLDNLEEQLAHMPEKIYVPTEEYCGIQICLVRSIQDQDFIQYWSQGGLCIAITPSADLREALLTGLGWGVDSKVIGNSRDLDYWDELNPKGFTYDYSYFVNAQRSDLQYLEGENRAFADQRAMSFPSEDRARIFYYSLLPGNEDVFASETMQAKLKTFCEGIREAYGWQKEAEAFAWEQYLDESLAYTK